MIGENNEPIGVVSLRSALSMAEDIGVDLVEIAPHAHPPVCRLVDYGKLKYQEQKRAHEARVKQKVVKVKEVKFRLGTDDSDFRVKVRSLLRFLDDGDKVKVTLRFRGREVAYQQLAVQLFDRILAGLDEAAIIEQVPKLEGRQMIMVLSPKKRKTEKVSASSEKERFEKSDVVEELSSTELLDKGSTSNLFADDKQ